MARFSSALICLAGLATAGIADASSLIVLDATNTPVGPSMIVVGAPQPAATEASGPINAGSIVAVGETLPAVSDEQLSSIGGDAPHRPGSEPTVIRAGIVGEALTRSLPAPAGEPRPSAVERTPAPKRSEPDAPLVGPSAASELDLR